MRCFLASCCALCLGACADAAVRIDQLALDQTLETTLASDGAPVADAVPVIAGKPALLRVFVEAPLAAVTLRFEWARAGVEMPAIEAAVSTSATSRGDDLSTTLDLDLPAEAIAPDVAYAIAIDDGARELARWPERGRAALAAIDTGGLRVTLVPIGGASAAGFVAPFTARALQLYPTARVELTIGAALPWTAPVAADGLGWDALVAALAQRRAADEAPADSYYYGLLAPADAGSCAGGCVQGLTVDRVSVGRADLDPAARSDETFVHELGHALGRRHAPCGVTDPDAAYPYRDAQLGVRGWDAAQRRLVEPSGIARDLMGYCDPIWISDYTYGALADRLIADHVAAGSL